MPESGVSQVGVVCCGGLKFLMSGLGFPMYSVDNAPGCTLCPTSMMELMVIRRMRTMVMMIFSPNPVEICGPSATPSFLSSVLSPPSSGPEFKSFVGSEAFQMLAKKC